MKNARYTEVMFSLKCAKEMFFLNDTSVMQFHESFRINSLQSGINVGKYFELKKTNL